MADLNQNEQLSQLRELAKRSSGLDKQLQELLNQYKNLTSREDQYTALLREFGLADELQRERQGAKKFKMASMIFIVFEGFSSLSQYDDTQAQLDLLDELIFAISDIASKYGIVKIPTMDDNILLCGGIKTENKTNPIDAACAAVEIAEWVKNFKSKYNTVWDVAMGIHTGPIIAKYGLKKKIPYTLSGNNVLTVSRLGRAAQNGTIVISPMTKELIKEIFQVELCGSIPVKYSGVMDMFLLGKMHPEMQSNDPENPFSEMFEVSYDRLKFMDLQEYMLDMLEEKLPKDLYYHNVKHTIDVTTEVELIGFAEGLKDSDIQLLKVAALFHDSGHIKTYKGHEEVSCEYAEEILPKYKYSQEKINKIKRIIMATKLPHQPSDIFEAVIQDSDLDYLGRSDFIPVSNMLYREITERGSQMTIDEWNKIQIKFISDHQYYTKTAQSLREVNKQIQIDRLKTSVEK